MFVFLSITGLAVMKHFNHVFVHLSVFDTIIAAIRDFREKDLGERSGHLNLCTVSSLDTRTKLEADLSWFPLFTYAYQSQ